MSEPARSGIKGVRYRPENLDAIYAENSTAVATMAAAAGPKPKLSKEDFKHNCSVFFKNLKALDTFSNEYKTMMANNLNTAAVVLQKIIIISF